MSNYNYIKRIPEWKDATKAKLLMDAISKYPSLADKIFRNLNCIGVSGTESRTMNRLEYYAYLRAVRGLTQYDMSTIQSYIIPPASEDDDFKDICFDIVTDNDCNYVGSSHIPPHVVDDSFCRDSMHINVFSSILSKYYDNRRSFSVTLSPGSGRIKTLTVIREKDLDFSSCSYVYIAAFSDTLTVLTKTVDDVYVEIDLGSIISKYKDIIECNDNTFNLICDERMLGNKPPDSYMFMPLNTGPIWCIDVFKAQSHRLNESYVPHSTKKEA
jgi:hypothetical protein